ncbi:hypothetical protein [Pseudomonas maumuensis]|uniref:Ig-like domain (Group 4) n=1 Tax=Pseudomonas maumuensis TaxID=2842354 RepID=A0ABX8NJJ0_9PSED|nr:hypothetical protein [Pseudomonas maumuensis]QXH55767.1 hypothetical protein KSS90_20915 [Pseudomonas maumuensis]
MSAELPRNRAVVGEHAVPLPEPVIPAAFEGTGIGWRLLEDEQSPLKVQVLAIHMQPNDFVTLYWNDEEIERRTVSPSVIRRVRKAQAAGIETSTYIDFEVPPSKIPDGAGEVWYKWEDDIGSQEEDSLKLDVMVKRSLPGGVDPDPSTPFNDNLDKPGGIPPFIDADQAAKEVEAIIMGGYLNRGPYDRYELQWHGESIKGTVPPGSDDFTVTVGKDIIEKVGSVEKLIVRYEIRDEVNNRSLWSPEANAEVDLSERTLAAPVALDADEDGDIDFNALQGASLKVRIEPYRDIEDGDQLKLTWTGINANQERLDPVDKRHTVTVQEVTDGIELELDNGLAVAALQGGALLEYQVNDQLGRKSLVLEITISGNLELDAPSVDEASGGVLDPHDVPDDGVTIRIAAYAHMAVGDEVSLWWKGTAADGATHDHEWTLPVERVGDIEHLVEKDLVLELVGGTLELFYTLTAEGGAESESARCELVVPVDLRRPAVEKAFGDNNDQLDFHRDFADASHVNVTVPRYSGMAVGDKVAVVWTGPNFPYQMPWQEIKAPGDVVFKLPRVVLLDAIGKTVEVKYLVERGGKPPEAPSEALALTVLAQKLELPAPGYLSSGGDNPKFSLSYPSIKEGDKVMIRWEVDPAIEPTLRESTLDVYKDGRSFLVKVDPTWPQADRRKTVFGSYSIEVGGSRLYSQVRSFKPD